MFFTRLAVAVLSFGSIAQVFAAPISTGLEGIPAGVSIPAVAGSPVRRDDLTFTGTVAKAMSMLEPLKAQIATLAADPSGAVTPQLATAMSEVAPAMSLVSSKLESLKASVDKDAILLNANGVGKTTSEAVVFDVINLFHSVDDIYSSVKRLQSVNLLETQVLAIKLELKAVVQTILPLVGAAVSDVLVSLVNPANTVFAHLDSLVASA